MRAHYEEPPEASVRRRLQKAAREYACGVLKESFMVSDELMRALEIAAVDYARAVEPPKKRRASPSKGTEK